MCQAAEHAARGVPTGLLDQIASICGVDGCGLRLDCRSLEVAAVVLPPADFAQWLVVWAGARSLAASGYGDRVAELAAAEAAIGPLRDARLGDVESIDDPTIRARARHVLSENAASTTSPMRSGGDLVDRGSVDVGEPPQPQWRLRLRDAAHRRAVRETVGDRRACTAHG